MKLVVVGDVAFEENKFFRNVKALLNEDDGFFKGRAEGDEIFSAFEDFLDDHYNARDMWDFSLEDKHGAVYDFIDEFFSWVCDDYREVEYMEIDG